MHASRISGVSFQRTSSNVPVISAALAPAAEIAVQPDVARPDDQDDEDDERVLKLRFRDVLQYLGISYSLKSQDDFGMVIKSALRLSAKCGSDLNEHDAVRIAEGGWPRPF